MCTVEGSAQPPENRLLRLLSKVRALKLTLHTSCVLPQSLATSSAFDLQLHFSCFQAPPVLAASSHAPVLCMAFNREVAVLQGKA
jgi:hypothetical protein